MYTQSRIPIIDLILVGLVAFCIGLLIGGYGGYQIGHTASGTSPLDLATIQPVAPSPTPLQAGSGPTQRFLPTTETEPSAAINGSTGQQESLSPTAIPIPRARVATATPNIHSVIAITEQRATELVVAQTQTNSAASFLEQPVVEFSPEYMQLSANVQDRIGFVGSGQLIVQGLPEIQGANLIFRISSAQIEGAPLPVSFYPQIEGVINNILRDELSDQKVEDIVLESGLLTVTVLQR